jgi:hypothetical protein
MMARVWRMSWVIAVAAVWCFTASPSGAIEVDLDAAAVKKAVEEGKKLKPEELRVSTTRFGADLSKDICGGGGEIQTKTFALNRYGALIAADPEGAEQNRERVNASIQKLAESKQLKIVFDFCGDTADFAEGSSATLEQGGRMIKGEMGRPDRAKKNEKGPAYRGKIAAYWPYGSFDPKAVTKITLFPPMGDAMSWEADFSKLK